MLEGVWVVITVVGGVGWGGLVLVCACFGASWVRGGAPGSRKIHEFASGLR